MKIFSIIGARPQFIKAAVISRAIQKYNEQKNAQVVEKIIHTGQHYDENMSDVFFKQMRIPHPDYNLGIGGLSHGAMTGEMLVKLEKLMIAESPDVVIVYGDTNSTLAGALSAAKLKIPVAHIEAGLRSYDMHMPEEINRIVSDRVSKFLFCPTETAVNNLLLEGIRNEEDVYIYNIGDVMYDAVLFYQKIGEATEPVKKIIDDQKDNKFILATVHRDHNTDVDYNLRNIFSALEEISIRYKVVIPLHPRTRNALSRITFTPKNVMFVDPVGYFDMITLLRSCFAVITDSGGLQKEAYFFNKPCVTLREKTEWVELIDYEMSVLAGADYKKIINAVDDFVHRPLKQVSSLYGNGQSGEKIIDIIHTKL